MVTESTKLFEPFFIEMVKEYIRHYPEKGDSWKIMSVSELETSLDVAYRDYKENHNKSQLVDIANFCLFIFTKPIKLPESCLICPIYHNPCYAHLNPIINKEYCLTILRKYYGGIIQ